MEKIREIISFSPFRNGFKGYCWSFFRGDLAAALVVALLVLPQAMAFSLVLGLPLSVGILSGIFGTLFTAAFGSSRSLVCSPSNAVTILLQTTIAEILFTYYKGVVGFERELLSFQIMIQITLVVGLLQGGAALLRMGRLAQYVSRPVMMGYTLGVACTIVITQLFTLTGIGALQGHYSLYEKGLYLFTHLGDLLPATLMVGGISLLLLWMPRRWIRHLPISAVMLIVVTGGLILWGHLAPESVPSVPRVADYGEVLGGIPLIAIPKIDFRIFHLLLPSAFAIAFLGAIEVSTISKSLSAKTGEPPALNQELFALGVSNFVSSFFGAMPCSGSFSCSMLNFLSGAKSRFAAVLSSFVLAGLVLLFHHWIGAIPLASLAAILFLVAGRIVDRGQLALCLRTTRGDAAVLLITFLAVLLFGLIVAFYIGVVLSVALYLKKASSPEMVEYTLTKEGLPRPIALSEDRMNAHVRIVDVGGTLFFGAVDWFDATMRTMTRQERVRVIILRLKHAYHLDASSCLSLKQLCDYLRSSGRLLILSGVTQGVWQAITQSGLLDEIGHENLFVSDPSDPVDSTQHAFDRAVEWLGQFPQEAVPEEESPLLDAAREDVIV